MDSKHWHWRDKCKQSFEYIVIVLLPDRSNIDSEDQEDLQPKMINLRLCSILNKSVHHRPLDVAKLDNIPHSRSSPNLNDACVVIPRCRA